MKEKYIISRWTFLCMPFEVYSAHVFNNSFGRVYIRRLYVRDVSNCLRRTHCTGVPSLIAMIMI